MIDFLIRGLKVVLVDILLAGDNAVLIAMAVRGLPPSQRKQGIFAGAGVAVLLRIILTFFAAKLLGLPYLRLIGGAMVLWIAVKLLVDAAEHEKPGKTATTLWQAVWLILVADITMSLDNILAVAAASKGDLALLIFGLGLSIAFVVFTSDIVSKLMDRFPVIIYFGSAILGQVGGEMIVADFHVSHTVSIATQAGCAVAVVGLGRFLAKFQADKS